MCKKFIQTVENHYVNLGQIVAFEILGPATKRGEKLNGTYQVRARTTIGWGTGGYGNTQGHLYVMADGLSREDADAWVRNLGDV